MSKEISETKWKETLMSILEELNELQYKKMLSCLEHIPKSQKEGRSRVDMVDVIVEHFGLKGSISAVSEIMKKIPRNDEKIQNLLSPFMDKPKERTKRRFKKNSVVSESDSMDKENEAEVDEPKSQKPDEEKQIPSSRKSIHDLKIDRDLGQKVIAGKVVQKSGLRTYQTKTKEQKFYEDKTIVSVEGTLKQIGPIKHVPVKTKQRTTERLQFILDDDSDSITVNLWGKDISELTGKSDGDFVRVINVKTSHYKDTVSLNSTDYTKILKVKSAAVENVIAQIIGIMNAGRSETELDAEISSEIVRLFVDSSLLVKAFGIRLNGDFEERLLEMLPLSANAKIQGNTIIKIEEM